MSAWPVLPAKESTPFTSILGLHLPRVCHLWFKGSTGAVERVQGRKTDGKPPALQHSDCMNSEKRVLLADSKLLGSVRSLPESWQRRGRTQDDSPGSMPGLIPTSVPSPGSKGKQTHLGHQHEPGEHLPGRGCLGVLAASACTMGELLAPHQGPCSLEKEGADMFTQWYLRIFLGHPDSILTVGQACRAGSSHTSSRLWRGWRGAREG